MNIYRRFKRLSTWNKLFVFGSIASIIALAIGLWPRHGKQSPVSEDERLKRIEFLQDFSKPLMGASVVLLLKQECTPEDLGHFRFLVEILNLHEPEPHPGLWIGGRDAYYTRHINGVSEQMMAVKSLVWSQNPDEQIQSTIFGTGVVNTTQLEAGGHLYKRGPYKTLGDLDQRCMAIYMTRPLLDFTAGIYVMFNDYWIAGNTAEHFVPLELGPSIAWPESLSEIEEQVPWIDIALRIEHPPEWMNPELARTGWSLDFSSFTPEKRTDVLKR